MEAYGWTEGCFFSLFLSCVFIVYVCMYVFLFILALSISRWLSYLSLVSHKFHLCVLALVMFGMVHRNSVEYKIDFTLGAICIFYMFSQLLTNVDCITFF